MAYIEFAVSGMTCGHCRAAVEKALVALPGVSSVHVDLEKKAAAVEFDDQQITYQMMKRTVEDLGYDVADI